ncbi:MAG: hypothetical protein IPK72_21725 [Candidatus Eisenbacteria bacterium]|nr:hypothetical protein [Candidatus Eisenbacteria bacterium]
MAVALEEREPKAPGFRPVSSAELIAMALACTIPLQAGEATLVDTCARALRGSRGYAVHPSVGDLVLPSLLETVPAGNPT